MDKGSRLDDTWEKAVKSVKKAVEDILRFQGKQTINKWFDGECRMAMLERNDARIIMLRNPSEVNRQKLALKQRKAKQVIRKTKNVGEIQNRNCRKQLQK